LAAEPRIKTNFYSSSVANYYSLVSLVYTSTLVECVPLCLALSKVVKRASYSRNLFSHFYSIAVTVSKLTMIHCRSCGWLGCILTRGILCGKDIKLCSEIQERKFLCRNLVFYLTQVFMCGCVHCSIMVALCL
jgi:hypothetical protein